MILSRYVEFIISKDKRFFLFNFLTKKWILLEKSLYILLHNYTDDFCSLQDVHPELYKMMVSEKFLIEDYEQDINNGIAYVKDFYGKTDSVSITINPTLDCNLDCWYCYESRQQGSRMSAQTVNDTIHYISSFLKENSVKRLNLSFFGGEPLLYSRRIVLPIIESIVSVCNKTATQLSLHFTTNGLLVANSFLEKLSIIQCPVTFQVAFDGAKSYHDLVKSFASNISCYDRAISKVKSILSFGFTVCVRCNYDKRTLLSFVDVVEDLKEFHQCGNLRFMFQRIWQEKEDSEIKVLEQIFRNEVKSKYCIQSNLDDEAGHSLSKCYADFKYNIVINYDGLLFRCTARDFTEENSVGRLTIHGCEFNKSELVNLLSPDLPYGKICRNCRILPICPVCIQRRRETHFLKCPIQINNEAIKANIYNVFALLTDISL